MGRPRRRAGSLPHDPPIVQGGRSGAGGAFCRGWWTADRDEGMMRPTMKLAPRLVRRSSHGVHRAVLAVLGALASGCQGTVDNGPVDAGADSRSSDGGAASSVIDAGTGASDGLSQGLLASDALQPMPDAFVLAYVGPGTGSTAVCGYQSDQTFVAIGSPLDPKPSTVTNGDFQQGAGTVTLSCAVDPSGAAFKVKINAEIGGQNGGSVTIVGNVDATGGTGIYGGFTSAQNGTFVAQDCSITFTYNMEPVPVGGSPVAAGRIWGHIDCPNAMESGTAEITADGGATQRTCDAHADFLFENCL